MITKIFATALSLGIFQLYAACQTFEQRLEGKARLNDLPTSGRLSVCPDYTPGISLYADCNDQYGEIVRMDRILFAANEFYEARLGSKWIPPKLIIFSPDSPEHSSMAALAFYSQGALYRSIMGVAMKTDSELVRTIGHELGHHLQYLLGTLDKDDEQIAKVIKKFSDWNGEYRGCFIERRDHIAAISKSRELWAQCLSGAFVAYMQKERRLDLSQVQELITLTGGDPPLKNYCPDTGSNTLYHGTVEENKEAFIAGLNATIIDVCKNRFYDQKQ